MENIESRIEIQRSIEECAYKIRESQNRKATRSDNMNLEGSEYGNVLNATSIQSELSQLELTRQIWNY